MKMFLLSCVVAIAIMVAAPFILRAVTPLSAQQTHTVGDSVRVGDADDVLTDVE